MDLVLSESELEARRMLREKELAELPARMADLAERKKRAERKAEIDAIIEGNAKKKRKMWWM
jgi:PHD/YefM family antitoxin component YafN of YafNO toxin-antitoxin module